MVPASRDYARQPDGDNSSVSGVLQSIRTALSQPRQRDDEAKPALSEFQAILASPPPSQPASHEDSEALLQQFVQWQQKPAQPTAP
jgi:DNA-binding transcriptional regulator YbjK